MSTGVRIPEPGEGTKPAVFNAPTLGHAVRLGELYDQRSGQFLGVQLYPEENVEAAETDVKHTELSLSLSTTLEDKASLLDINAKLSLEILSGMVSVSGSASYVKDTKSNTNEQAFALALKMRLKEKRILFAEAKLGRKVLDIASRDYISSNLATHFVSAIVYGGNLVVNLVAKQSKLDTEEKLEGQLQAKFDKLKGAISLEGEVKADIKDKFNSMDDKFDLVMHGDIALDRVPVNPKDVLEIIPEGAKLITADGGVPISVTLQPIPRALTTGSKVYQIDTLFVDLVMKAFSQLDDLRSRFAVLVDGAKSFEEFVPELARIARAVAAQYTEDQGTLLYQLRKFLDDFQHGNSLGPNWKKESTKKAGTYYVPVLRKARKLYNYHLEVDDSDDEEDDDDGDGDDGGDKPSSGYYPTTLAGLENELLKFQHFVYDIQALKDSVPSLKEDSKKFIFLSSLDAISKAIRLQNRIPLFFMPPFMPEQDNNGGNSNAETTGVEKLTPDLSIIQFLAIVRENAQYFNNHSNPARILYAETAEALERRLPTLLKLKGPSLVIGEVDAAGKLSWIYPPLITKFCSKFHHKTSGGSRGDLSYDIDAVKGRNSFSIQVRARTYDRAQVDNSMICFMKAANQPFFLTIRVEPLKVQIKTNYAAPVIESDLSTPLGTLFVVTFVQDIEAREWTLYLGDKLVGQTWFTGVPELLDTNVQLAYDGDDSKPAKWWSGEVFELRAFSYAFTKEQVEAQVKKE